MALSTEAAQVVHKMSIVSTGVTAICTVDLDAGFTVDPQDLADDLKVAWSDNLMAQVADEWTHVETVLYVPDSGGSIPYTSVSGVTGASGEPASPAVCALVTKNTAVGGRKGKGRFFLPGIFETLVDASGIIQSGYRGNLQSAVDGYYTDVTSIDPTVQIVVHTRSVGGLPSGNTLVTALTVEPKVATQRRRQRR